MEIKVWIKIENVQTTSIAATTSLWYPVIKSELQLEIPTKERYKINASKLIEQIQSNMDMQQHTLKETRKSRKG